MTSNHNVFNLFYINIRGQTGLEHSKQVQIKHFFQVYNIAILHCQEINILENSFEKCNFINSLESRGGKPPLILVARFARTNVADYVR